MRKVELRSWAGRLAVLAATSLLVGCLGPWGSDDCGNGVLDEGEACDDGRGRGGLFQPEHPCESCQPGWGYACDEDGVCEPVCNDGILADVELCDPSTPSGAGYCAPDCSALIASCGDGLVQPAQEDCDSEFHGCVDCREGLMMTCTEGDCVGSGLDPELPLPLATEAERATFCAFYVAGLGGERVRLTCGTVFVETGDVESCIDHVATLPETCTVEAYERWIATRESPCQVLLTTTRSAACWPPTGA